MQPGISLSSIWHSPVVASSLRLTCTDVCAMHTPATCNVMLVKVHYMSDTTTQLQVNAAPTSFTDIPRINMCR